MIRKDSNSPDNVREPESRRRVWMSGALSVAGEQELSRRLGWLCLIYAGTFTLAFFPGWLSFFWSGQVGFNLSFFVALGSIGLASVLAAVSFKKAVSTRQLLRLGFVFEVVGAFGIGVAEVGHMFEMSMRQPDGFYGISWICTWVIIFPLILPSRPKKALLGALAAATMGPLALFLVWISVGRPALPPAYSMLYLGLKVLPNYIAVAMAFVAARIVYSLRSDVQRERELGSYRLVSLIGRGGMGEVWKAEHRMLIRSAAIKLIRPDKLVASSGFDLLAVRRRFEKEAQATAVLHSPHTVELYDFGVTQDGTFYHVMELLNGIDLEALVSQYGPQPPGRVIFMLRQVCHSLRDAHFHKLVHRDVKPANVFACRFGPDYDFVKVLDFGLVKSFGDKRQADTRLTVEGVASGTPAYMAPELAMGRSDVDHRVDLYALGCVAYWLLTGLLVFEGRNALEIAVRHVKDVPIPPSERSELPLPKDLEEVIMRCLRKDPADRPQDACVLDRMLAECADSGTWSQDEAARWWQSHLPEH